MSRVDPFQILKARYCIAAIIVGWYWQPGKQMLAGVLPFSTQWYWRDILFHYYAHGTIALFLTVAALAARLEVGRLPVRSPVRHDLAPIFLIFVLTYCAGLAIDILLFVPLSYLFPNFVNQWLAWWSQPIVYLAADGAFPLGANTLSLVSLVILSPILEELLFRGYLLHRWANKWGLWPGVLLSSAVFGAIHPDTLAIAVAGLGFAMLYLKTQTLWAPIAAHSLSNLVNWLWYSGGVAREGVNYYAYTIDQLRDDWWIGVLALVIVVLLVDRILRRNEPLGPFALPACERRKAA